jgi:hypothetical protein
MSSGRMKFANREIGTNFIATPLADPHGGIEPLLGHHSYNASDRTRRQRQTQFKFAPAGCERSSSSDRMIIRGLFIAALMLALAAGADAREIDGETDLGLVADNPSQQIAARNTALLTETLEAQWTGGKFKFANGRPGPILYPIRCAAKQFFFAGTITTGRRIGGALYGGGGRSYIMTEHEYSPRGQLGGAVTRFTRIDGEKGGPVIRLRGTGFVLDGINIMGRRWPGDRDLSISGAKSESCIEVEGRAAIATGCHTIRNCLLGEAKYGIRTIPGYYNDAGAFVKDENHADQGVVDSVTFAGIESCFRSENQQAVGWSFRDVHVDLTVPNTEAVLFDIVRGGNIAADNIMLNHNRITISKYKIIRTIIASYRVKTCVTMAAI